MSSPTRTSLSSNMSNPSSSTTSQSAPQAYDSQLRTLVGRLNAASFAAVEKDIAHLEQAVFDKLNVGQGQRDLNVHFLRLETAKQKVQDRIKSYLIGQKGKWLRIITGGETGLSEEELDVRRAIELMLSTRYASDFKHQVDPNHVGCVQLAWKKEKMPPPTRNGERLSIRSKQRHSSDRSMAESSGYASTSTATDRRRSSSVSGGNASKQIVPKHRKGQSQTRIPISHTRHKHEQQNVTPVIEQLVLKQNTRNEILKVNHVSVSRKKDNCDNENVGLAKHSKVLLLTGATGAGKTSLLNGIANFVYGIQLTSPQRLVLVSHEAEGGRSQAISQTDWISSYTFQLPIDSPLMYELTVIDTPGLDSTTQKDESIISRLSKAFKGDCLGVEFVNMVGLVVPEAQKRLTQAHQYVLEQVLALFGRDIGQLDVLVTFSDQQQTGRVTSALDIAKVPYHRRMFSFNNGVLLQTMTTTNQARLKMAWISNNLSYSALLQELSERQAVSLTLTREMINEQEQIVTDTRQLVLDMKMNFVRNSQLRNLRRQLQKYKGEDWDRSKFTLEVSQIKKTRNEKGEYLLTACDKCNTQCHFPCNLSMPGRAKKCSAINHADTDKCKVCNSNCARSLHETYRVSVKVVKTTKQMSVEDLMKHYNLPEQEDETNTVQSLIHTIDRELELGLEECKDKALRIQQRERHIQDIALRPNKQQTVLQYLQTIRDEEEGHKADGYKERLQYLNSLVNCLK